MKEKRNRNEKGNPQLERGREGIGVWICNKLCRKMEEEKKLCEKEGKGKPKIRLCRGEKGKKMRNERGGRQG